MDNKQAFYSASDDYIYNYCVSNDIDINDINPSLWIYLLLELKDNLYIPNKNYLYLPDKKNKYDINKVLEWYDILKKLSFKYKQEFSIYAFENMTSITDQYIYNLRDRGEVSAQNIDLYKNFIKDNENSLSLLLQDKKVNPMHYLPILNKKHNWNDSGGRSGGATVNLQLVTRDAVQALESKKDVPNLPTI